MLLGFLLYEIGYQINNTTQYQYNRYALAKAEGEI